MAARRDRSRRDRPVPLPIETDSTAADVTAAALSSTGTVAIRGVVVRVLGFAGSLVFARLLTPRDFGALAFGLSLTAAASLLADGGLGSALIRRTEEPDRADLRALQGFQLGVTTVLAMIAAAGALFFGTAGLVTAIMIAALPLQSLQAPGSIMLERQLQYGRRVRVELSETVAYLCWGIGAVSLGFGVVGLASAAVVRSAVGVLVMRAVSPVGLVQPSLQFRRVHGLLGFGVRFQGAGALGLLRDQGTNVLLAALVGLPTLGLWSLAYRVIQVPALLFESLWRVSFPAMSRLLDTGADPVPVVKRALRIGAVGTGALLVPFAAMSPHLIEVLFGARWGHAGVVLPWAAVSLLVGGPVSVAAAGYLYAIGDARTVLLAVALQAAAWLVLGAPLVPAFGLQALGSALLAATLLDVLVLAAALRRQLSIRSFREVRRPTTLALVVGAAGWSLGQSLPSTAWSLIVSGVAAEAAFLLVLRVLDRGAVTDLTRLVQRMFPFLGSQTGRA
jgi:O-antigen/teichoic acid export membrane protein